MTPYPSEFPREALAMVLDLLRGKSPSAADAAHACWEVAGYSLGQTLGGGPLVANADTLMTDDEVILLALEHAPQGDLKSAVVFPWGAVLLIVLRLLYRSV